MLRSRILRMAMLAFSALWFGVLVPVHQRGLIRVAGTDAPAPRTCCATSTRAESGKQPASAPSAGGCAVCQFIATLDLPPAILIDVPPLGFVAAAPLIRHESAFTASIHPPCSERGPPASCFVA